MKKNMFERFRDDELPEGLNYAKHRASLAKSNNEYWFTAGFFLAMMLNNYRDKNGEISFIVKEYEENENNKSQE